MIYPLQAQYVQYTLCVVYFMAILTVSLDMPSLCYERERELPYDTSRNSREIHVIVGLPIYSVFILCNSNNFNNQVIVN